MGILYEPMNDELHEAYIHFVKETLTLDNIFKYASKDELRAIVSSIIGRLNEMPNCYCSNCNLYYTYSITDKDLDIFVKELRDVK